MKNIRLILVTVLIAFLSVNINAQSQKVGYINSAALLQTMPEVTTANQQLEAYIKKLDNDAMALANDYKKFAADLEPQLATMSDLQEKEVELMKPIEDKAMEAINAVADRQGFSYILNSASLVYVGSGSIDILPMVKAQLGIQ